MSTALERTISRLPSREKAVLSELTQAIRKYRNQAPLTLARLLGLAFESTVSTNDSREDKLARAQVRGLEVRQQMMAAEGGSYSSEDVARLLQISKTAVLKRLAAGRLLAWREERLQAARFPRWQFDDHGHVLNGLEDVLEILDADQRLDIWGKILFFLQEKPALNNRRALDLLREGKLNEVHLAAQAYVE